MDKRSGGVPGGAAHTWRRGRERWWTHRVRLADWIYALGLFPFVAFCQVFVQFSWAWPLADAVIAVSPWPVLTVLALVWFSGAAALYSLAVLYRRKHPQRLLFLGFAYLAVGGNIAAAAFALYSYAARGAERRLLSGWFALMALVMYTGTNLYPLVYLACLVTFLVVPTVVGLWVGTRRQLVERLQERAERLEREQHLRAEHAITAERTRIAREMHDVVAHRVSLMVLHAGGLEVSADDPRTIEAAGLIRTTGREALTELRGILGVLRDEPGAEAPTAPQPALADLDRLVEQWRGAGTEVERTGSHTVGDLPPSVQRTVYRLVQEGLTNAAKHAPGAPVTVAVDRDGDSLRVEVANGPAAAPVPPPPHSGYGLAGLRERVALVGGTLTAGPRFDGGWRLRALLPAARGHETAVEGSVR
ncbi:sensor histidine kinase [Nocardiopsis sp. LOL_012]|uniref:sensor histidine kinase n=1 Tax=Nocardiopsis sp. LOL_012 TaxID=3345409 RepID=UPI003A89E358